MNTLCVLLDSVKKDNLAVAQLKKQKQSTGILQEALKTSQTSHVYKAPSPPLDLHAHRSAPVKAFNPPGNVLAPSSANNVTASPGGMLSSVPSGDSSAFLGDNVGCLELMEAPLDDKKGDNVGCLEPMEAPFNDKKGDNVGHPEPIEAPLDDKKGSKDLEGDVAYLMTQFS